MKVFLFALSAGVSLTLATSPNAMYNGSLASEMVDSSIARGQGLYGSTASTSWIELGIFQQALRASIAATNDSTKAQGWSAYLNQSLASLVIPLSNATADTGLPLDRLSIGSSFLYDQLAGNEDYERSIAALQQSVREQPQNANGGLWYYKNQANLTYYHNLSYLDGMFSYAPFAILSALDDDQAEDDLFGPAAVLNQLQILQNITQQSSGLLVHGYDASKAHKWSNPNTGASPNVWGRSLAWYTLGTVNALDILQSSLYCNSTLPKDTYEQIKRLFSSIIEPQIVAAENGYKVNGTYGVWQVVDRPGQSGNFIEASASSMTVYSLLHSVRLGLIDSLDLQSRAVEAATGIYTTVVKSFISEATNGTLSLSGTSSVASLSGEDVGYQKRAGRANAPAPAAQSGKFIVAAAALDEEEWLLVDEPEAVDEWLLVPDEVPLVVAAPPAAPPAVVEPEWLDVVPVLVMVEVVRWVDEPATTVPVEVVVRVVELWLVEEPEAGATELPLLVVEWLLEVVDWAAATARRAAKVVKARIFAVLSVVFCVM